MKNRTAIGRIAFWLGIAGFLLVSARCTFWTAYRAPLGPTLDEGQLLETMVAGAMVEATAQATIPPTSTHTPLVEQEPVCGETGSWNILILGTDVVAMRGDAGSDLTSMMRVDFSGNQVTVYAFSRELWVNTSGLGLTNPTVEATELGTVYYEAFRRSNRVNTRDAMVDGTGMVAKALLWNFLLPTDHYLAVDLSQVPAMVDAIGGIPIDIPKRTTDPWIGMVIEPGQQTLNGVQAAAYARAKPDSEFGRIQRQQLLLDAARRRLVQPDVWTRIPQLYAQFNQVVATDLSLEQINHLACLMNEVPRESIRYESVRPEWTSPGPYGSFLWDKSQILRQLSDLELIP